MSTLVTACLELPSADGRVRTVAISTESLALSLGDTVSVSATVRDETGTPVPTAQITWSSNNPAIVLVSTEGLVTAVGAGTTDITAESGGRSASATVAVSVSLTVLSAGLEHTCGVTDDLRVACWGQNQAGKLGDGTLFASAFPVLVADERALATVSTGGTHTCSLNPDGLARCWGANWSGQLGIGSVDAAANTFPNAVAGELVFTSLSAGDHHTCAVTELATAYCWGGGFSGQLGNGMQSADCSLAAEPCNMIPTPVSGSTNFQSVTAGQEHTCGLAPDGRAHCWGFNLTGALGDSSFISRATPGPVGGGLEFASLSAGDEHVCGLTPNGSAYCWGSNSSGQLGDGTELNKTYLVPVGAGLTFASLRSGGAHTCGITTDGTAYCWGANGLGQLGDGSRTSSTGPVRVAGGIAFASLATGVAHTCGISLDGRAYCWGVNSSSQLGTGTAGGSRTAPTPVAGQF